MKKIIIILFAFFSIVSFQKAYSQVGVSIDFNTFYNDMSPYGDWVDDPQYGRVWVNHEQGLRPYYTNGYWAYTRYGWTWVSDYSWGWAAFHYGRWAYNPRYGWVWIPGYEWAPAWVTWSGGGDYYGWAPLGPGWGVNISFGTVPVNWWAFVPRRHMGDRSIHNYYEDNSRNNTIINNNVTIINNYQTNNRVRYHAGPARNEVERVTQKRIQPLEVKTISRPGKTEVRGQALDIYRPIVKNPNPQKDKQLQQKQIQDKQIQQQQQQKQLQDKQIPQKQIQDRQIQQQQQQKQIQDKQIQQKQIQDKQIQQQQQQKQIQDKQIQQQQQQKQIQDKQIQQQNQQKQMQDRQIQQQQQRKQPEQQPVRKERPVQRQPVQKPPQKVIPIAPNKDKGGKKDGGG